MLDFESAYPFECYVNFDKDRQTCYKIFDVLKTKGYEKAEMVLADE